MADNYLENVKQTFINPPRDIDYEGRDSQPFDEFIKLLGYVLPDKVTPEELIVYLTFLIKDINEGTCRFLNSKLFKKMFNNHIETNDSIDMWMTFIPGFIQSIASPEFSQEFLGLFRKNFYQMEEEDNEKKNYGCIEIEPDVIDISNKDKAEVLAALYNHSKPIGAGISQYDPRPITVEVARMILQKRGYSFDYLKGRTMKVNLEEDKIWVYLYNEDNNHPGLAQKAISTCKNINKEFLPTKEKILDKKKLFK